MKKANMRNYNYNLVKLLHCALDNVWRIEKHYENDSADLSCGCKDLLDKIKKDNQKHAEMLLKEISKHDLNE